MVELIQHSVALGLLVAMVCAGLRIASEKGAILYPVLQWLIGLRQKQRSYLQGQQKQLAQQLEFYKKEQYEAIRKQDQAKVTEWQDKIDANQATQAMVEAQQLRLEFYHKPLLSCISCMPSVHSIIPSWWCWYFYGLKLDAIPFAICFATILTTTFSIKVLKQS